MKRALLRFIGTVIVAALAYAAMSSGAGVRLTVGCITGLPSFALMVISRRQLGASFAVKPRATGLVTTGLYSRIQHPMYLFLDLFLLSVILVIGMPVLILAWAVLVIVQAIQAQREEKILSAAFGPEHEAYVHRVWV